MQKLCIELVYILLWHNIKCIKFYNVSMQYNIKQGSHICLAFAYSEYNFLETFIKKIMPRRRRKLIVEEKMIRIFAFSRRHL